MVEFFCQPLGFSWCVAKLIQSINGFADFCGECQRVLRSAFGISQGAFQICQCLLSLLPEGDDRFGCLIVLQLKHRRVEHLVIQGQ
ncbi:hypothetical protein D3C87_1344340 [compost metagenome]